MNAPKLGIFQESHPAQAGVCFVALRAGKYCWSPQAAQELSLAVTHHPTLSAAYYQLARVYARLGETEALTRSCRVQRTLPARDERLSKPEIGIERGCQETKRGSLRNLESVRQPAQTQLLTWMKGGR